MLSLQIFVLYLSSPVLPLMILLPSQVHTLRIDSESTNCSSSNFILRISSLFVSNLAYIDLLPCLVEQIFGLAILVPGTRCNSRWNGKLTFVLLLQTYDGSKRHQFFLNDTTFFPLGHGPNADDPFFPVVSPSRTGAMYFLLPSCRCC